MFSPMQKDLLLLLKSLTQKTLPKFTSNNFNRKTSNQNGGDLCKKFQGHSFTLFTSSSPVSFFSFTSETKTRDWRRGSSKQIQKSRSRKRS